MAEFECCGCGKRVVEDVHALPPLWRRVVYGVAERLAVRGQESTQDFCPDHEVTIAKPVFVEGDDG